MLTKNDLKQFEEIVEKKISDVVEKKVSKLLDKRITPLENRLLSVEKMQKRQGRVFEKKLDLLIRFFDKKL